MAANRSHRFLDAQREPDGSPRLAAQRCHERLYLRVRLAAIPSADVRHDDLHLIQLPPEEARDLRPDEERVLRRCPQSDAVGLVAGDTDVRLHRVVIDHRKRERILENAVAFAERRLDVSPLVAVLVAEVGVVDRLAGRVERGGDASHDGQLLVVDLDEVYCGLRSHEIDGSDGGDRFALEAHLPHRDDGAVLLVGAVMRLHVHEFGGGEHGIDAGERARPRCVDPGDASVRQRAQREFRVGHAEYFEVAGELRAP